jgi:hypothetical protein
MHRPLAPLRCLATLVVVVAGSALIGSAASLALSSGKLGAAEAATARCTSSGVTVAETITGTSVSSVTMSGIPATCAGASLSVTLNNGAAHSTKTGTVPAGGGSMTLTVTPTVPLTQVAEADIVMTGP